MTERDQRLCQEAAKRMISGGFSYEELKESLDNLSWELCEDCRETAYEVLRQVRALIDLRNN